MPALPGREYIYTIQNYIRVSEGIVHWYTIKKLRICTEIAVIHH